MDKGQLQAERFFSSITRTRTKCLLSNNFKYVSHLHKSKKYKEWRCAKQVTTKCRARFCGDLDDTWYWKHNTHHTCVGLPQNDLKSKEEEKLSRLEIDRLTENYFVETTDALHSITQPKHKIDTAAPLFGL